MARLIDADALMKAIKAFRWISVPNTLKLMFDYLKIIINEQPTVDAVEVVHGRIEEVEIVPNYMWKYRCSCCQSDAERWYKYCPNCGAKMDGERKDND